MSFCLDDGAELLYGPAQSEPSASGGSQFDDPQTAILLETASPSETATRAQIHTTEQTAVLPSGITKLPKASSFDKRLLLAPLTLAVIVLGGVLGYRYFRPANTDTINSVAVLPFENRSGSSDADYLSDGLAESLIFRLNQLPGLKVSPVSSVVRYKGTGTDVQTIASELGVDAVMTGRLVIRGDSLSIAVELVDARDNRSLWGEQYERKMSELLATQREIAAAIVDKLQIKLGSNEKAVAKKYTDNSEAYQLYLKGRYHFARRTKADMERSIELFQQATELDPNFALAYVGIAETYTSMPSYPYISPNEATPKALTAITRALELDPELPEAHAVSAMITTSLRNYAKAEQEFKRAIELGPNLAITHYRYGWIYLSTVGRHDEAVAEMKRAMELEPLSIQQGANYASVLIYARRFDEAVQQARKTYELDPKHIGALNWLCHALNAVGRSAEAVALRDSDPARPADRTSLFGCMGVAYARTGQREKALQLIAEVNEAKKTRYVMSYWLAAVHAALGDKEAAFAELETAYLNRDWFLPRLKVDPYMDPLRDDPRFDELVKRLNLPE
jgi:TolB-like protein/Flp pilus assembly protein TadD